MKKVNLVQRDTQLIIGGLIDLSVGCDCASCGFFEGTHREVSRGMSWLVKQLNQLNH